MVVRRTAIVVAVMVALTWFVLLLGSNRPGTRCAELRTEVITCCREGRCVEIEFSEYDGDLCRDFDTRRERPC